MYLFYLGSDTLVKHSSGVIRELLKRGEKVKILTPFLDVEKAESTLENSYPDLYYLRTNFTNIIRESPKSFICCNDWAPEAKLIIWFMRKKGVPTIALQESVVDLSFESDKYTYSDLVCVQGYISSKLVKNETVITGNPRYSSKEYEEPNNISCLINSNFTYGIFEKEASGWIDDITSVLTDLNIDFKISKHPRDNTNLSLYLDKIIESGADKVEEQINNSSIIITRFSSLIHESILLGRRVIYYNPFEENMGYDFSPDDSVLAICNNREELRHKVILFSGLDFIKRDFDCYINQHLSFDPDPTQKIVDVILDPIIESKNSRDIRIISALYFYSRQIVKRIIIKNKRR
ncbi:hypothetical protein [Vibrio splendidus]|uniref:hypothetical protein n=1 Tax=Vibrio splendidus TaxID=29497 RepID=UPI00080916AA|nr:hypothetical protein [Vibrio splendidus]SBS65349.1 hypothetical protein VHE8714_02690 [Vibrio splendidus]